MAVAARAASLDSHHPVGHVPHGDHMGFVHRRPERRPARSALKLGLVLEKRQGAEPAAIDTGILLIQQTAAERGFGPVV